MAQGKAVSHMGTRIAASIFALACTLLLTLPCSTSPYALADEQATALDAAAVSSPAAFGTLPHILFISSYDYDWDSVPKQLTGFVGEINGSAKVDYLFMDTKACSYDDAKATTYGQIEQAFARGESYDLIVLGDDAALDFALEYQSKLFAGLPLVFEGINTEAKAYSAAQDPFVTGVVESFPMEQTVEAARKLSPQATQIVAIADDSESCKGSLQQYFDCQGDFPSLAFKVMDCSTLTGEQITQQLGAYGDDTILLFLMMSSDSNNVEYSQFEAARIVSKSAHIPVFKADEL
ncbi:MAG: hypothetical protein Q4G59_12740, partial [Planctomycetia bacterium]|nr:hypothetical protein [Planctomycetia bacterium]